MIVLGINAAYHESAAALVVDGRLVAAAEEERFNRRKHAKPARVDNADQLPERAIDFCLERAAIAPRDIDAIAYSFDPEVRRRQFRIDVLSEPGDWGTDDGERAFLASLARVPAGVAEILGIDAAQRMTWVPHHLAHAASAYYAHGADDAAVLVVDGIGEHATALLAAGRGGALTPISEITYPDSLGFAWEKLSKYLGFSEYDACKVMGLAAYGDPSRHRETLKAFLRPTATGFAADPEVLEFRLRRFDGLERLLGPARRRGEALESRFADLAAALQEATDRIMLRLGELAHEHVGSATLCLAGGVALNCRSNWVLKEHGPFAEVFVPPGAHDAGTAIGAAMLVSARAGARPGPSRSPYVGPAFDDDALAAAVRARGLEAHRAPDIADEVAGLLAGGSVVGWFQEAMEFGPRALGNRSLLADPRDPGMRDTLNRKVKHREEFRPFAPSVLAEKAESWFEMGRPSVSYEYMLFACPVRVEQARRIPAVVHEDGTSRIQIVRADVNARFHRLLSCFEERTGVPLLLNTSFNDSEPIVCTPEDALATFAGTRIDAVALGNLIVRRPPTFDTSSEHDDRLTAAV